ncbi:MAG: DNA polymerase III subunit gamma/tau [Alphaproteobacteria bacterium]
MNSTESESTAYRVLARKYRPSNFDELIGQEALVRTLSNAIRTGRIAHAFMLTGVRGIGKTTTARIIARALNCIGPDGSGGPTVSPCGTCANCTAIAEDRHVDVMEMDAASRTGVDDIRELIESVRYRPVSARYKVYIVDEVHMLSRQAFNALLKTLEEPPAHVLFVFATTEIRRVPVTVLSRCQRFDLRRVEMDRLGQHLAGIAERENAAIDADAIAMLARAADGSVRDGLSLLDQAIALGSGTVTGAQVREMLGLADRAAVFDLYDRLMAGDVAVALDLFDAMYRAGADPVIVIQDLLDATYWLTRLRSTPSIAEAAYTPEIERTRGRAMAEKLRMPVLARNWQLLLKGLGEVQYAPQPRQAAEMLLLRLAYAAELPPPGDLVAALKDGGSIPAGGAARPAAPAPAAPAMLSGGGETAAARALAPAPAMAPAMSAPMAAPAAIHAAMPRDLAAVAELFREKREPLLYNHIRRDVFPVHFEPGRIEVRLREDAPRDLVNRLSTLLSDWTGTRWVVSVSSARGGPSLQEQADAAERRRMDAAERNDLVRAVKDVFPGAKVTKVTARATAFGDPVEHDPDLAADIETAGLDPVEMEEE